MIEVKGLFKSFDDKEVLRGIDATFKEGNTNLIIGRSGAGKSVFVKCMICLIPPTQGQVLYDGRDIALMKKKELLQLRREMGMLFQGSALFDSMTVFENVMFPMEMFSHESDAANRKRAKMLLERVGLQEAGRKYQRYLFCDEPNSGLDPKTSKVIDLLIQELTREYGITTIINTHDMNTVRSIGDKIIYVHHGEKAWEGTSATIETEGTEGLLRFINASVED